MKTARVKNGSNAIIVLIKTWLTQFARHYLLVILKIVIFNVDFVHENPISNGICKEILFSFPFFKNATSALFASFQTELSRTFARLPSIFFLDFNSPW